MDYRDKVAVQEAAMWSQSSVGQGKPFPKGLNMGLRGALPSLQEIQEKAQADYLQRREALNQCTAEASAPTKEIPHHMNRLFNATDRLERRVIELGEVLACVTTPEYPAVANGAELKAATNTGLGDALDRIVERLEGLAARVDGLIERVQV